MRALISVVTLLCVACGSATAPSPTSDSSELRIASCGRSVSRNGDVIDVRPTGADDTRNLQCAIDTAIAAGRPVSIQLAAGTFHTAQLVATNFLGRLAGHGADATVLTTLGVPMFVNFDYSSGLPTPPGGANPWPAVIAFVDGDFSVSDLAIRVLDEAPTTGWSIFGLPPIKALAQQIVIVGTFARASFERVTFIGKNTPTDLIFGNNVYNAVFYEGFPPGAALAGTYEVKHCRFVEVAAGAVAVNVRDGHISYLGNTSERTQFPAQLADFDRTKIVVSGNRFHGGAAGIQVLDGCAPGEELCGLQHTQFLLSGNSLEETDGIEILATFGDGVTCAAVGNDIRADPANGGVGVWLGPGTKNCLVVTDSAVRDEGTANRVIMLR